MRVMGWNGPSPTYHKGGKSYGAGYEMIAEIDRLRAALLVCANHADDMPLVVKTAIEALDDKERSDG